MKALGWHYLVEFYDCDTKVLDDVDKLKVAMQQAADLSGANVVQSVFHRFSPYGVSGVVVIAESHFSIHTWPEYGYAACDLFTCGEKMTIDNASDYLHEALGSRTSTVVKIDRGVGVRKHV